MSHTPGPWYRSGNLILAPNGGVVAEARTIPLPPAQQANACLIAAAPELLEALRNVLPFIQEERETRELSFLPEPHGEEERYLIDAANAVQIVEAAIAKAEGREP